MARSFVPITSTATPGWAAMALTLGAYASPDQARPVAAAAVSRWQVLGRRPTYPSPEPRVQLDHVLGGGTLPPVRSVETPVLDVSDHRALVVELG